MQDEDTDPDEDLCVKVNLYMRDYSEAATAAGAANPDAAASSGGGSAATTAGAGLSGSGMDRVTSRGSTVVTGTSSTTWGRIGGGCSGSTNNPLIQGLQESIQQKKAYKKGLQEFIQQEQSTNQHLREQLTVMREQLTVRREQLTNLRNERNALRNKNERMIDTRTKRKTSLEKQLKKTSKSPTKRIKTRGGKSPTKSPGKGKDSPTIEKYFSPTNSPKKSSP